MLQYFLIHQNSFPRKSEVQQGFRERSPCFPNFLTSRKSQNEWNIDPEHTMSSQIPSLYGSTTIAIVKFCVKNLPSRRHFNFVTSPTRKHLERSFGIYSIKYNKIHYTFSHFLNFPQYH